MAHFDCPRFHEKFSNLALCTQTIGVIAAIVYAKKACIMMRKKVRNEQTLFFFVNSTFKYSPITKLAPEQTVILFWRHSGVEGEE